MQQLAKFQASLRRPKPTRVGVTAELYVRNGPDADSAMMLGTTAWQDSRVRVDMGEDFGAFEGYLRRPLPRFDGFVVCVFGENGTDADRIQALGLSTFLDKDVDVVVWQLQTPEGAEVKAEKKAEAKASAKSAAKAAAVAAAVPVGPKFKEPSAILYSASLWGTREVFEAFGGGPVFRLWAEATPEAEVASMGVFERRRSWCWHRLKQLTGRESMSGITASEVHDAFTRLGIRHFTPREIMEQLP